jgi:hypothetical protein
VFTPWDTHTARGAFLKASAPDHWMPISAFSLPTWLQITSNMPLKNSALTPESKILPTSCVTPIPSCHHTSAFSTPHKHNRRARQRPAQRTWCISASYGGSVHSWKVSGDSDAWMALLTESRFM